MVAQQLSILFIYLTKKGTQIEFLFYGDEVQYFSIPSA